MNGKIIKKMIPISIILLFLGMAISPVVSADDTEELTVWMPGITEDNFSLQMQIEKAEAEKVNASVDVFMGLIEGVKDPNSPGGEKIVSEEWGDLLDTMNSIIYTVQDIVGDEFPEIDVEEFTQGIVFSLINPFKWFMRSGLLSIGRGFTFIPFYDYEQFFGFMFRPIFVTHMLGFSSMFHFNMIPPRLEYADRIGIYRYVTIGFTGLFLNIGDLGREGFVGPVMLMGKGYNALGNDFP